MSNFGKVSKSADIEKAANSEAFNGLPEGTIYHDPTGSRAPRAVNLKQDMFETVKSQYEEFDRLFNDEGKSLRKSVGQALETDTYNLPVYYVPEVQVVNPELTPLADMLARETVSGKKVDVTARDSVPSGDFGIETSGYPEASSNWDDEGYLSEYTYEIADWGVKTQVSDFMRLASAGLRSAESVAENALIDSQRFDEEDQAIFGTDNDSDGFDGIKQLGTSYNPSASNTKGVFRELKTEVEKKGADPGSIAFVCDFDSYDDLRNELDDFTRYEVDTDELGFGYNTLEFDMAPVMRSHSMNDSTSADPQVAAIDLETTYWGVLQDTTVKSLAKTEPTEQMAVDAYETLVAEAPSHIQYVSASNYTV